jgi:serine protease Do
MKRTVALTIAAAATLAGGLLFAPVVRAGERDEGEQKVEKRIVVRHAGGGMLGVGLADLEADARGAKVQSVESGSPAEKAGIKKGDVITRFDGEAVRSAAQLARLVRETPPGRSVPIEVTRDGATQKLVAKIGEGGLRMLAEGMPGSGEFRFELPESPALPHGFSAPGPHVWRFGPDTGPLPHMAPGRPRLGVEYIELSDQLAAYFKVGDAHGVLVTSVAPDSAAAKGGLKAGDVIMEFDGRKTRSGGELRDAVGDADGGKELVVKVLRDARPLELKVTLAKPETKPHEEGGISL